MRLFTNGWLHFLQNSNGRSKPIKKNREKRGYAPWVEMLEGRSLPSISFSQAPTDQTNFGGAIISSSQNIQAVAGDSTPGQTITYSATGLPSGLSINGSTGFITGTIDFNADVATPYNVDITASDVASGSQDALFTWNVEADPISFANPGTQSNFDGATINVNASGSNSQVNALTYSATGLPGGLSINPNTGFISGEIGTAADSGTPYHVTVTATDATANSSNAETFDWDVNAAPITFMNPGPQTNFLGATVSLSAAATDSLSNALVYSATGLPDGLGIDPNTGIVSGQISQTANTVTPFAVTVTATDAAANASTTETFTWDVSASPVALTNPGGQTNIDNDTVSLQLQATDSPSNAVTYSAIGLPPNLVVNPTTGLISGSIAATANTGSPYTVTVTATDATANAASSQTFTWFVLTPSTIVFTQIPGTQTNFDGATVTTSNGVQVTANETAVLGQTVSYTATGLPPGLSIDSATGIITGPISLTADTGSPYTVTITASDTFSTPATTTFQWNVSADPISFTNPGTQTSFDGGTINLATTATDTQSHALTFAATGLPAGLTIDPNTGTISGQVSTSADTGSPYTVVVKATDATANASNTETFTWNVSAAPITLTNPGSQGNSDGATVSLQIAATDSQSNALTYSATNLPLGLSINSTTGKITGQVSFTADTGSPYTVTVTATDATANAATSQTFTWAITASTVTLTQPANQTSTGLQKIDLAVSASDSAGHKLTYAATGLPSGLTINANTGAISGTIAENANSNSPYTVTVTATDATANASQAKTFTWTVNPGPIDGVVFFDANGNGNLDAADPRMPGVKVTLVGTPTINITAVTNVANPTITTATADNLQVGDQITIAGVGGATGMNGTLLVASTPTSTTFTVTTASAPGVYTSGGTITPDITISAVTNAATTTITTTTPDHLIAGQKITIAGVVGATGINGTFVVASTPTSTSFTIKLKRAPGVYVSGGTVTAAPPITISAVTNAQGVFSFANPPAGNYTIQVQAVPALFNAKANIGQVVSSSGSNVVNKSPAVATPVRGGLRPSAISLNAFLTSTRILNHPFGAVGSGIAFVTHAPIVSTPIAAVSLSSTTTTSAIDLAGHFTDADMGDSTITMNIMNGTTPESLTFTLFDTSTPQSVANFMDYIKSGEYNDSIFSRLVAGFVLQGGGAAIDATGTSLTTIPIGPTVPNEFKITNAKGTISMAQSGGNPNSATDQFFINLVNNNASGSNNLDAQKFTVFGKIDSISQANLTTLASTPTFAVPSTNAVVTSNPTVDLNNLPLTGYTGGTATATSSTFPADATASNYMVIQSVTIDKQPDFLTYTVTSSNPAIVSATLDPVHNEQLTLTKGTTTGTATVTVTATNSHGLSVTTTITVTVSS